MSKENRWATPERSLAQRRDALKLANDVRKRRAQLKRDLKEERVLGRDVLLDPPEWTLTMRIAELLLAMPYVGQVRASRIVRDVQVSPARSLGGLTDRQRAELAARVPFTRRGRIVRP